MPPPAPLIRIVFPSAGNGRNQEFLRGITDACQERHRWNFDLQTEPQPEALLARQQERPCDGIIAFPNRFFRGGLLAGLGVPVVTVLIADGDLPAVVPDDPQIGRMAARHLAMEGWTPFAAGDIQAPWWDDRLQGWREVLPQSEVLHLPFDDAGTLERLRRLPPRAALFCANDVVALRLASLAPLAGRIVGRDLRLLGVDDTIDCHFITPALSSIKTPLMAIGHRAVRTMARLLQGAPVPRRQILPPLGLIVRGSSTPLAVAEPWLQDLAEELQMTIFSGRRPSLQRLSGSQGRSASTVERAWKAAVGCSMMAWIQTYRREVAQARLAAGDRTLDEVARSVGLASGRSLQRLLGHPPG